jgi:hypothetical protein
MIVFNAQLGKTFSARFETGATGGNSGTTRVGLSGEVVLGAIALPPMIQFALSIHRTAKAPVKSFDRSESFRHFELPPRTRSRPTETRVSFVRKMFQ